MKIFLLMFITLLLVGCIFESPDERKARLVSANLTNSLSYSPYKNIESAVRATKIISETPTSYITKICDINSEPDCDCKYHYFIVEIFKSNFSARILEAKRCIYG
jgi:hypothetical protein